MVMGDTCVVMPVHRQPMLVGRQLAALGQQTDKDFRLILVVDENDDETFGALEEHGVTGDVLLVKSGQGEAYARNMGTRYAGGGLVLGCDPDDVVSPLWVKEMKDGLKEHGCVGGRLDHEKLNHGASLVVRRPANSDGLDLVFGQYPRPMGCNHGYHYNVWKDLGGFDEDLRLSTDTDFFIRAGLKGYRIGYRPDALVWYRHSADVWQDLKKQFGHARVRPLLHKRYCRCGRSNLRGLLGTMWLWATLPRGLWSWRYRSLLASQTGRLIGSVQHRSLFL